MATKNRQRYGQEFSIKRQIALMEQLENGACPLCGREMIPGPSLNEHHLVPRSHGGTEKFLLHRVCHGKIHAVFSESELARSHHTFENLRSHPEIAEFIKWVRKQPPEANPRHAKPKKS